MAADSTNRPVWKCYPYCSKIRITTRCPMPYLFICSTVPIKCAALTVRQRSMNFYRRSAMRLDVASPASMATPCLAMIRLRRICSILYRLMRNCAMLFPNGRLRSGKRVRANLKIHGPFNWSIEIGCISKCHVELRLIRKDCYFAIKLISKLCWAGKGCIFFLLFLHLFIYLFFADFLLPKN